MEKRESYPIGPGDINTGVHFFDAFGKSEREVSANYIVRFCQTRGWWVPFTKGEIEDFYNAFGYENFQMNGLDDDGNIVLDGQGRYCVTHEFVARCFLSAPADKRVFIGHHLISQEVLNPLFAEGGFADQEFESRGGFSVEDVLGHLNDPRDWYGLSNEERDAIVLFMTGFASQHDVQFTCNKDECHVA